MVESTYNALNLFFTWFSLANFYIFFVRFTQLRIGSADAQVILTSALEGTAFNIPHIGILNHITQASEIPAHWAVLTIVRVFGRDSGVFHLRDGESPTRVRKNLSQTGPDTCRSPWKYKFAIYFFALLTT